jgi:hypothetical protein
MADPGSEEHLSAFGTGSTHTAFPFVQLFDAMASSFANA